jgi:hypothetical protein
MKRLPVSLAVSIAASCLVAACAATPITVSSTSTPMMPSGSGQVTVAPTADTPDNESKRIPAADGTNCVVHLTDVRDVRLNPDDLGMMGGRAVHTDNSIAWVQNALNALKQDSRLTFAAGDSNAQLTLRIELVKAYIMTLTTQKSSNVVVRISYTRNGKDFDSQIVRGRDESGNWANGADEAQGSLNRALASAVSQLGNDIVARCKTAIPGK